MKRNPHCPVAGCQTKQAHAKDPGVQGLIQAYGAPEEMTFWACAAIAELRDALYRDYKERRFFAWFTRLRQPEELYIRTLYAVFIANEKELHHILSGERPNGLAPLYAEVNRLIFAGRGLLLTNLPGLQSGTFRPIDPLNDGAHASFRAFLTSHHLAQHPENLPDPERFRDHLTKYCSYLEYMHGMFKAGREKKHVLAGVINLHRPATDWHSKDNAGGRSG